MELGRRLQTIISGGQTGVDQAALRAAQDCGLQIDGWCPPARECETGVIPQEFPLKETPYERSPHARHIPRSLRTEWNVRDSDATLILSTANDDRHDSGVQWTRECARRYGRPCLICDPADPTALSAVIQWIDLHSPRTLNIAGPSEGNCPGISKAAYDFLLEVFQRLLESPKSSIQQ